MKPLVVVIVIALLLLVSPGLTNCGGRQWRRPSPLLEPLLTVESQDGAIVLEDGRRFRPAGVTRRAGVSAEDWDEFLGAATAQGVLIEHDLGDGRAMLRVEPKFYNWCGTSRTWAGDYVQCGLSELSVLCGYAEPSLDLDEFDERDQWRMRGSLAIWETDEPDRVRINLDAFRYSMPAMVLKDLDGFIEAVTDTPMP